MMIELLNEPMLKDFLQGNERVVLYKHSPRCSVSSAALREMKGFSEAFPDVPIGLINVITSRALSIAVVDLLGVIHQSPQVIVVEKGKVLMHASHFQVRKERLVPYFHHP